MQELIFVAFGGLIVGASMAAGYWAGRNSAERPFRSEKNPKPIRPIEPKQATPEPEGGDFYQDAAFGGDEKAPVPTIMRQ
jgi:hypothetical protein